MTAARPDTWMPLYIGDYLQDTMHLTTEQHGAYFLLIMACWKRGGILPVDEAQLGAIARLTPKAWQAHRPVLAPFFQVDGTGWRHKRVSQELGRAKSMTEAKANAGAKGAAKRWQTDSTAIAEPLANASQIDAPSPSQESSNEDSKRALESEFERWYAAYPIHKGRAHALKAFRQARKLVGFAELLEMTEKFRAATTDHDPKFIKHPATWLNGQCWADDVVPTTRQALAAAPTDHPSDKWRRRITGWLEKNLWLANWGDLPTSPRCEAYREFPELADEFRERVEAKTGDLLDIPAFLRRQAN